MSMYKFVNNFNDNKIEYRPVSLYQVASFMNPKTKTYHIRRFIIDENNEFKEIKNYQLSQRDYHKFLQQKKSHEYKLYAVYDFSSINFPNVSDILLLKSNILNTNYDYSGYAPF